MRLAVRPVLAATIALALAAAAKAEPPVPLPDGVAPEAIDSRYVATPGSLTPG